MLGMVKGSPSSLGFRTYSPTPLASFDYQPDVTRETLPQTIGFQYLCVHPVMAALPSIRGQALHLC